MTDDLVKRLRKGVMCGDDPIVDEAADRIEKLESELVQAFNHMMNDTNLFDEASDRIEELEAALSHYACGCKEDKCTPDKLRYRDIKCGWPARQALEGKNEQTP